MDLIGKKVFHTKFGEGTIAKQEPTRIHIQFETESEQKIFVYPSCFKSFIKLLDNELAVETEMVVKKQKEQEQKRKKTEFEAEKAKSFTNRFQDKYSKLSKKAMSQTFSTIEEFCNEYKRAIVSEVVYLKNNGGKRLHVFDGKRIEYKNGNYVYTFESDEELKYPEGTQISIWLEDTSIPGSVVCYEDFTIVISTGKDMGLDVPYLEFSAEPWRLLSSLSDRLDDIMKAPSEIVKSLICEGHKSIDYTNHHITTGQTNAVQMSASQPITFVWGPPGTGKTQTLAKIALEHIERGHHILMLSYSNVSVDGAIMRLHNICSNLCPGTIVRYGYPKQSELLEHDYLTSYNLAIHNHPELLEERKELIDERKKLSKTSTRYVEIGRKLTQIKNDLSSEEKQAVKAAQFVATTVSKAIVDNTINTSYYDVVIFDEASMAYVPQIVFAASLSKKHFICMGDFRQLPPIVQNSDTSLLNTDIFQHCAITTAVNGGWNHKWLCMLNTQYRMHPSISDFVSATMYSGLLKSADEMQKMRSDIVKNAPASGHALAFADLSGMMSVCTKTGDDSRVNVLSALISVSLAIEAAKSHEVGIISPYHAQSKLLHAMVRDMTNAFPQLQSISCATVHQFQGSEKDVIIFDAVDCYRIPYPGILLTSSNNNYANRLFNVALTRAKGKFIGVTNIAYMENKNLSKKLIFKHMIETQKGKDRCLTSQELSQKRSILGNAINFFDNADGYRSFLRDIKESRYEVRIDLPDSPSEDEFTIQLVDTLQEAKSRGIKVYIRAEKKQSVPSPLKPLTIEDPFVANPITTIDKKIVWFGMPSSDANFKSEGQIIKTKQRPIIRFVGKYTAATLYGFMKMSKTVDHSKTVSTDEAGNAIINNFSDYVLAKKDLSFLWKADETTKK